MGVVLLIEHGPCGHSSGSSTMYSSDIFLSRHISLKIICEYCHASMKDDVH